MQTVLIILLVAAVGATLFALGRGLLGLLHGNITPQRSQDLMRKRILFQGAAIFIVVALLLLASN